MLIFLIAAVIIVAWVATVICAMFHNLRNGHGMTGVVEGLKGHEMGPKIYPRKVIDAKSRKDGSYKMILSDGKNPPTSIIAVTSKIKRRMDRAPKQRSYVQGVYPLLSDDGDYTEIYLVCVNYDCIRDVEDAINRYLKREYFEELQAYAS